MMKRILVGGLILISASWSATEVRAGMDLDRGGLQVVQAQTKRDESVCERIDVLGDRDRVPTDLTIQVIPWSYDAQAVDMFRIDFGDGRVEEIGRDGVVITQYTRAGDYTIRAYQRYNGVWQKAACTARITLDTEGSVVGGDDQIIIEESPREGVSWAWLLGSGMSGLTGFLMIRQIRKQ